MDPVTKTAVEVRCCSVQVGATDILKHTWNVCSVKTASQSRSGLTFPVNDSPLPPQQATSITLPAAAAAAGSGERHRLPEGSQTKAGLRTVKLSLRSSSPENLCVLQASPSLSRPLCSLCFFSSSSSLFFTPGSFDHLRRRALYASLGCCGECVCAAAQLRSSLRMWFFFSPQLDLFCLLITVALGWFVYCCVFVNDSPQSVFTLQPERESHTLASTLSEVGAQMHEGLEQRVLWPCWKRWRWQRRGKQKSHCVAKTHLTLAASCGVPILINVSLRS